MRLLALYSVFLTLFSCKDEIIKEYYQDGSVRSEHQTINGQISGFFKIYDKAGNIREIHNYKNGKKNDSSLYLAKNGEVTRKEYYIDDTLKYHEILTEPKSEGPIGKFGFPEGKWTFFKNGKVDEVIEYRNVEGKSHLNQNWLFDENQDTILISDKSSHYKLTFFQDTISLKDCATGLVDLYDPLFDKNDPDIMVVLPKNGSANFNGDFSNVDEVETDTIYNLNIEYHYRKEAQKAGLPSGDYSTLAFFGRYFTTPGTKKFRGIIVEFYNVDPDSVAADGMRSYKHKKYFEHTVFVKDTVEQK